MNILFKVAFVCAFIGIGALTMVGIVLTICCIEMLEPTKTETYIGEVVDVNADRIILSNGNVIFAQGIDLFEWKRRQTYIIKVETYSNRLNIQERKNIKEVKEVYKKGGKHE